MIHHEKEIIIFATSKTLGLVFYQLFIADSWLIKAAKVSPKNLQCKRYKISNASPCLKPAGNSWICVENSLRQSSIRERQLVCSTRLIRPGPSISGRILLAANFSCFAIAPHPSCILNIYHNIILTALRQLSYVN